jgi:hypothetical protein
LHLPEERFAYPANTVIWQYTDPMGSIRDVPPAPGIYRVYRTGCTMVRRLSAINKSDILMIKAGINQLSVALLLDTGASDNYMNIKLVKALGLSVRPDYQNIKVALADGHTVAVTGTVTVPVCIGRFRAKVEFLVTDLDAAFDAVLGFTWLRRNCDLHFSKNLLAFRNGAKVTCFRLPPTQHSTVPAGRWSHKLSSVQPFSGGRGNATGCIHPSRRAHPGPRIVTTGTRWLSFAQANRLVRKGGQAWLLHLKVAEHIKSTGGDLGVVVDSLLEEFSDVFNDPPGLPPMRNVAHVAPLIPGSRPPYRRNYRMTESEKIELKKQLTELLEKGLINPSVSPFGSPVLLVKKSNEDMRLVCDFRSVNRLTIRNRYPLPRIDDLLDQLSGAKCFSSLDLKAGYNQIRLHEEDKQSTAITTPFGHFEWAVLPQGMANSPSIFVSIMNEVFKGMEEFVLVYFDDILIFSKNPVDHEKHVRAVLTRLREHQFYAKRSKCEFFKDTLLFLGVTS